MKTAARHNKFENRQISIGKIFFNLSNLFFISVVLLTIASCKKAPVEELKYTEGASFNPAPKTTQLRLSGPVTQYCISNNETLMVDGSVPPDSNVLNTDYWWLPGNDSTSSITVTDSGNYSLTISMTALQWDTIPIPIGTDSLSGDTIYKDSVFYNIVNTTDSFRLLVSDCRITADTAATGEIYAPSSFSPDGDHINDTWFVKGGHVQRIFIEVRNNSGAVVFTANTIDKEWDGRYSGNPVPEGYYLYYIEYRDMSGNRKTLNGRLELFRF